LLLNRCGKVGRGIQGGEWPQDKHEQKKSHQNCDEEARERDKQAKGKAGYFVGKG
jgi:hypothetical protein